MGKKPLGRRGGSCTFLSQILAQKAQKVTARQTVVQCQHQGACGALPHSRATWKHRGHPRSISLSTQFVLPTCAPKCSLTPQSHARLGRCQSIPTSLAWPPFNLCMCLIPRAGVSLLYHFSQAVSPESLHRASTCHTYLGPTPARAVIRHFPCPTCSCEHSCY